MRSRETATVFLVVLCVLPSNTAITRKPVSGDPPAIDPRQYECWLRLVVCQVVYERVRGSAEGNQLYLHRTT